MSPPLLFSPHLGALRCGEAPKKRTTQTVDHVHPIVQTLNPEGGAMYQDDNGPIHTARLMKDWFDEHESEAEHLPWPAKSPDLNIIEPLWGVSEERLIYMYAYIHTHTLADTHLYKL